MRLSEIKGEKALDVIVELIDPLVEIVQDKTVRESANGDRTQFIKAIISNHKQSILHIMAVLEDKDPATYEPSLIDIPNKLIELTNDSDFAQLFFTQAQRVEQTVSFSATANTEESEN